MSLKPTSVPVESETCKILKALHAIQSTTLITFLPTILNQLFALLVVTTSKEISVNIIRVLINLVNMVHEVRRKDILQAYTRYVFTAPETGKQQGSVHGELYRYLPGILDPINPDFLVVNKFMHHSMFFFEIIIKSMAQHLLSTRRIKVYLNYNLYMYNKISFYRCIEMKDFPKSTWLK